MQRFEETIDSETVRRAVADGKRMPKEASEGEVRVRRDEKKGLRTRGRMKSTSFWVMVSPSILYMVVAILFFRGSDTWSLFSTGNLREFEDFLVDLFTADVLTVLFAPLTFFWVLYGYSQQSKERASRSRPHLTLRIASSENW